MLEDKLDEVLEGVCRVGEVEAFAEAVDEDAWVRALDGDLRVGAVAVVEGEEHVAGQAGGRDGRGRGRGDEREVGCAERLVQLGHHLPGVITDDVIPEHRVDADAAEEASTGLERAEEEDEDGDADGGVDATLDRGEDGDEHADEENEDLEG